MEKINKAKCQFFEGLTKINKPVGKKKKKISIIEKKGLSLQFLQTLKDNKR